ncbi:MAG: hypothetical protein VKJ02_13975 [Snowella sp.]|nr:hypothetical protein [Snowella sp.]
MNNYIKFLIKQKNAGFTLVELIVASVMTFFVVGGAGYGLFIMTRENVASNAASDTQYNLNRAAEFISDEIRTASAISVSQTPVTVSSPNGNCGTFTPILTLTIPFTATSGSSAGTSAPYTVYYYSQAPGSPWLGTNAIYRCGPSLQVTGANAGNVSTDATTGLPVSSTSNILVDLIATNSSSSCQSGWTASAGTGFFACIDNANNKLIELHLASSALDTQSNTGLRSSVTDSSGNIIQDARFTEKANYSIITRVAARAN